MDTKCRFKRNLIRKVDQLVLQVLSNIGWVCFWIAIHIDWYQDLKLITQQRHRTCLFPLSTSCTILANLSIEQIVLLYTQVMYASTRLNQCGTNCLKFLESPLSTSCFSQLHPYSPPTYIRSA